MGRQGSPKTLWGNILKEGTAGVEVLEQNMLGWGIFLHSLLRVGGPINGQVHPLRALGIQRAHVSPGGTRGSGRTGLSPSFYVLAHSSLALGQRPSMYRQTEVRKDPHRASTARYQMDVGTSWKGCCGQMAKKPVLCLSTWSCILNVSRWGFWEGPGEEGKLCRQKHGNLIRTNPKSWWCRRWGSEDVGLKHVGIHSMIPMAWRDCIRSPKSSCLL